MDIFDEINNNTTVNTLKQISETGNREVSVGIELNEVAGVTNRPKRVHSEYWTEYDSGRRIGMKATNYKSQIYWSTQ